MENDTDIDAFPVPRREGVQVVLDDAPDKSTQPDTLEESRHHEIEEIEVEPVNHRCRLKIPEPPEDWKFNNLLTEISRSVSGEELELFKGLFRGHGRGSIGKRSLNGCKTCIQLFALLREREYISRDNVLYLQKLLLILDNKALIQKAIQYCQEEGHVYFYQAPEEPEEGSNYVKFHVEGRDLKHFHRRYLLDVRDRVAAILWIPPEDVRIVGVGPSSSFCVTPMIPETYAATLRDMLERKQSFPSLCELSIDFVCIEEKLYNITGTEGAELDETEQQRKIKEIYEQFENQSKLLEKAELKIISLSDSLEAVSQEIEKLIDEPEISDKRTSVESKLHKLGLVFTTVQTMHISAVCVEEEYSKFREELHKASIPESLRETIKHILNSNTQLVSSYTRKLKEMEICRLQLEVREQKEKALNLERQLEIHKYLSYRTVSEVNLLKTFRLCQQDITLEQFEKRVDIIKTVSKDITEEERSKIMSDYHWDENDPIKQNTEDNAGLFLIGIICKEYKKTNTTFDIEAFISLALNKVKREDLADKFQRMTREVHHIQQSEIIQWSGNATLTHHQYSTVTGPFTQEFPRLTFPAYPQIHHNFNRLLTGNVFNMVMQPIRSFVWCSVQTFHFF